MLTHRTYGIIFATLVSVGGVLWIAAPGKAREADAETNCAGVTWPAIPAPCLIGGSDRRVRGVSADHSPSSEMAMRFTVAFE